MRDVECKISGCRITTIKYTRLPDTKKIAGWNRNDLFPIKYTRPRGHKNSGAVWL